MPMTATTIITSINVKPHHRLRMAFMCSLPETFRQPKSIRRVKPSPGDERTLFPTSGLSDHQNVKNYRRGLTEISIAADGRLNPAGARLRPSPWEAGKPRSLQFPSVR